MDEAEIRERIHERRHYVHAVCTFCGVLCDDIVVRTEDQRVAEADTHGCAAGQAFFLDERPQPVPRVRGGAVTLATAVDHAATVLAHARHPLILGLSATSSEAQQRAVALADGLGASIDAPLSPTLGPRVLALQMVGEVFATLGEVKNRGDLILCWGVDPLRSHPRLLSRDALEPAGLFVPRGRGDRTLVVIDTDRTATAAQADWFLQVRPAEDFEALVALRAWLRGHTVGATELAGRPAAEWRRLLDLLRGARYGVIFYGPGLSMTGGQHHNLAQLFALVQDLHRYTRCTSIPLRGPLGHGNAAGAYKVLTWQTGYAFAVNMSRGYPRYNPGEFTMNDLLRRGEVDALLVLGDVVKSDLSQVALHALTHIPRVVVGAAEDQAAEVSIQTGTYGIHAAGTMYRLDGVPVRARQLIASELPSDAEVLTQLLEQVRSKTRVWPERHASAERATS